MPYNYDELKVMGEEQLRTLADSLEVKDTKKINKKEDLAFAILDRQAVLESQKPSEPKPKKRGRPRKSEAAPEAKPAAEASSERKKEEKKPADKAEKSDAAPKSPEKKQQPKQRKEAQQKAEGAKSRKKTGDAAAPAAPTAPVAPAGKPEGDVIADAAAKPEADAAQKPASKRGRKKAAAPKPAEGQEAPRQEGETESLEFARAVQESILTEAGYSVIIGIGAKAKDLSALHAGFLQASRAISIGRIFCENQTVFDYASMLLPRFLSELSPDIAERYHHLLFNPSTSRLFNEEMLRTIEVFFQKDLNLSDTARQLYIHRNTLVYRLDKVQRETGLDLRKFEDALTFRMLLDMRKCKYYTDCTPD